MIVAWRLVALIGIGAWATLSSFNLIGRAQSAAPAAPPGPLSADRCAQLDKRVERELASAAQGCKSDTECKAITFEYAFRPCGTSVRTEADLTKVTADAKRYRDRCNPVIRPVRCAYLPTPRCERGRCVMSAPAAP